MRAEFRFQSNPVYNVYVGGQARILKINHDKDGEHFLYFKDSQNGPEFLGEEIIWGDQRVYDSYMENDLP